MKKIIIILVCILLGFILYTFIVALYKTNSSSNVQTVLPSKNINKQEKLEFEKTSVDKTKINSDKLIVETTDITNSNNFDYSSDCTENCEKNLEKKKVEIYLIQNINKLVSNNGYTFSVTNYTVDTRANTGIVVYKNNLDKYTKNFFYTEDNFGDITNMYIR